MTKINRFYSMVHLEDSDDIEATSEAMWTEADGFMKVVSRDGDRLSLQRFSELEHIVMMENRIAAVRDPAVASDHDTYLDDLELLIASLKNAYNKEWVSNFLARHRKG